MKATPLTEARMGLGESIIWDEKKHQLLWVDVGYPSALYTHRLDDGVTTKMEFDFLLSGVALTNRPDTVILLTDEGLKLCHLSTQVIEHYMDVESDLPQNRCNDCGVDSQGRLWFGTMENNMERDNSGRAIGKGGNLYCLSDGVLVPQETGLGIPNTLLWSPDEQSFYMADSIEATLFRYNYNGQDISEPTVFSKIKTNGVPDGSTIDTAGKIWNCRWGDAAVFVLGTDGVLLGKIPIPALQVTSCTFGGRDMTTLFVTTANYAMTAEETGKYPLAGSIFQIETKIKGTTRNRVQLT